MNKGIREQLKDWKLKETPKVYRGQKLRIVNLVRQLFYFPSLLEAKNWCDENVFENE